MESQAESQMMVILHFFFSSFEEAKQEVGDLIAFAWQQARQQAEGGVDMVVQAMLAREAKPNPPAPQVKRPAPSIKVKPTSAPRVVRQVEKPPSLKEPSGASLVPPRLSKRSFPASLVPLVPCRLSN